MGSFRPAAGNRHLYRYYNFTESIVAVPLTFQHRAGVSPYTSAFALAETCVFGKQSPGPFHCGHLSMAPLLANLRGHFAEFLNNSSLAHH